MDVRIKRAYEPISPGDGYRVLIDRLWPRGVSREQAHLDALDNDLAPSKPLREWFGHEPGRYEEFRRRYIEELRLHRPRIAELRRRAREGTLTLVHAARDAERNDAVVLAEIVRRGFPSRVRPSQVRARRPEGYLGSRNPLPGARTRHLLQTMLAATEVIERSSPG